MLIAIVDKHAVTRLGTMQVLGDSHRYVEFDVADGNAVADAKPDLVILEVFGFNDEAFALADKVLAALPGTKILIHTLTHNPTYVGRAKAHGVWSFIEKGDSKQELLDAVAAAAAGKRFAGLLGEMTTTLGTRNRVDDVPLTPRETQVLRHLAMGLSNKEIAQSLTVSIETVKEHVQHLLRKLGVNDRTQAAVWAVRKGIA